MEKAREHQRDLYMCFIDYKKALDCVDHERLWVILRDMGVPVLHLIVLLKRQPGSDSQDGVWRQRRLDTLKGIRAEPPSATGWRGAALAVARGRMRLDGTM